MTEKKTRPTWMDDGPYMVPPYYGLNDLHGACEFDILFGHSTPHGLVYLVYVKDVDKLRDVFDYDPPQEKEIPF